MPSLRRTSSDPDKPGLLTRTRDKTKLRLGQIKQVYGLAAAADRRLTLWVVLIVGGATLLGFLIGRGVDHPVYFAFLGLLIGLMPTMWLVARKAEAGAYGRIAGQPGEVGAALGSIRRGWSYTQEPVAVDAGGSRDPRQAAMVFRAIGRPGVVLIAEGPVGRASKLLASERKRTARLIPNVPVHGFRVGAGEGADVVATKDLVKRMNGLDKTLTKHEVPAIDKRLRSIGGLRPPIPQGIDPNRVRGKNVRR